MKILKKIEGNEMYLYMNENLIYKRCIDTGLSKVLDVVAYEKYISTNIRDLDCQSNGGLLPIKARIKLKTTKEGGRHTGFTSGYRPNHVFEYHENGQWLQTYIGDIIFEGKETIEPGEEREVIVRFLMSQPLEKYLDKGRIWWIHEGPTQVGQAEVI